MAKSEQLVATKSFLFGRGRTRVFPGDDIDATPQEAKLLFALKRVTRRPDGQRPIAALLVAPVQPPAQAPVAPPAVAESTAEAAAEPAATEAAAPAAELPAATAELPDEPVVETPPAGTGEGAAAAAAVAKPTRQRRTVA